MRYIFKVIVILMITLGHGLVGNSQSNQSIRDSAMSVMVAYLDSGSLDSASSVAEFIINNTNYVGYWKYWYYRGVIYKEMYNIHKKKEMKSEYRETATTAFQKALEIQGDPSFQVEIKENLKYLATTYYDDAIRLLDVEDTKTIWLCNYFHDKYIEIMQQVQSDFNKKEKLVAFYNTLGVLYSRMFQSTNDNKQAEAFYKLAKHIFFEAVSVDSLDKMAQHNLLVLETNYKTKKEKLLRQESVIKDSTIYSLNTVNELAEAKIREGKLREEAEKKELIILKNKQEQNALQAKAYQERLEAEKEKQRIIIWSVIAGLFLAVVFGGILLKSYKKVQKAYGIITSQKEKVEKLYSGTRLLSEIGYQITASLSIDNIIDQAYENINKLMDASVFGILLFNEKLNRLEALGLIEKGGKMPTYHYELTDTNRPAVLCFNQQKEVVINDQKRDWEKYFPGEKRPTPVSGERPESLMYLPLTTLHSQESIGVITVQSFKQGAYDEYHIDVLKNLAVYVAVALNNAEAYKKLGGAYEELKQTQMQLVQSEKMAALGQLIAGVAHEINTPMGVIKSSVNNISQVLKLTLQSLPEFFRNLDSDQQKFFSEVMELSLQQNKTISTKEERKHRREITEVLEKANIDDVDTFADTLVDMGIYKAEPYLDWFQQSNSKEILLTAYRLSGMQRSTENITTAADRASKIVFALKSFVHFDSSGDKIKARISDGLETVLSLYHNLLKQGVDVVRNYSDDIQEILCFPDELNQVWTNLIHNALQAMDHKGIMEIAISKSHMPDQHVECVKVSITDSGKGIPENIQDKIFNPFFTTKKAGEGSGLGLDIVKKIIDKHEGMINFESKPGSTTFNIFLPIFEEDVTMDEAV